MAELFANNGDPDKTLHSVASDLDLHSAASDQGLHSLPITLLGVSCLQWVIINDGL